MSTMHKVLDAERLAQLAADPVEHAGHGQGAQPEIDFSTLQLDDPRITEECKQTFTQLVGRPWPGQGEYEVFAAIWAMARLSKPSDIPESVKPALEGMIRAGCEAKERLDAGIPNGDPVHPVSARLTWPLAIATGALHDLEARHG